MLYEPVAVGSLELKNRLVMPPMQTDRSSLGHVTDDMVQYYADRARYSNLGLLTGGVTKLSEAEALLLAGKADLIGVGRALFRDARWAENA